MFLLAAELLPREKAATLEGGAGYYWYVQSHLLTPTRRYTANQELVDRQEINLTSHPSSPTQPNHPDPLVSLAPPLIPSPIPFNMISIASFKSDEQTSMMIY